jgi:predicted metal-dependent hydrolase
MAQKQIDLDGIGPVLFQRRKGTRTLKLSVRADGKLRVGMPPWMPYKVATTFVYAQQDWIAKHAPPKGELLTPDMAIGKTHRLVFSESETATRPSGRIVGTEVRVTHPQGLLYKDEQVQKTAERVAVKALTKQAERLLPQRLQKLAERHGFTYTSVEIRKLRSRWGSCNSRQEIILNCYLLQLPWHLIDYVLLHELVHTRIMRHGEPFWTELSQYVPDLDIVRKDMRRHSPTVLKQPL